MDFATLASDFEPAGKAAAAAPPPPKGKARRVRKAPPVAAPAPAPAPAAPEPPPPPPVFVGGKPRSAAFPLDYPVFYDGRTYDAIVLRRPTEGEVAAFMGALEAAGEAPLPIYYTVDDAPVPVDVIRSLDVDDRDRIMERVWDFLPIRLQRYLDALASISASTPASGDATAPTS